MKFLSKISTIRNFQAFTLIELLVVIAIISIISLIGAASFRGVANKANDAKKKADIEAMGHAYEANYSSGTGYKALSNTQFASNTIPIPPEGGSYFNDFSANGGFRVCAGINGGENTCNVPSDTCFCKESSLERYIASVSSPPGPEYPPSSGGDVTSQIENIGNPTRAQLPDSNVACRYARNVWDLQSFNSKLYIGSGNSANSGPCSNAGSQTGGRPIISYNPATNVFTNELTIAQEQIDRFNILNGNILTVPGHDPTGTDSFHFYTTTGGSWTDNAPTSGPNIAGLLHAYDMASFNTNTFFMAGSGQVARTGFISINSGSTWTDAAYGVRAYDVVIFGGKVYMFHQWAAQTTSGAVYEWAGSGTTFNFVNNSHFATFFPGQSASGITNAKLARKIVYSGRLVYIGANNVNDHQSDPFGIFSLAGLSTAGVTGVTSHNLPGNAKPWDLLIGQNGKLYVLGSIPNGTTQWVTVSSTSDVTNWTEEFRFNAPTFARSFEQLNGSFYFGLGTDTSALSVATGDILRLP